MGFNVDDIPDVAICNGEFSTSETDPFLFFLFFVKAFENEVLICKKIEKKV